MLTDKQRAALVDEGWWLERINPDYTVLSKGPDNTIGLFSDGNHNIHTCLNEWRKVETILAS